MNIGAFGENFPYTNFHDLNLDWIISVVKDFLEKYSNMSELINGKVNLPKDDPVGKVGDYLISLGNGETKWESLPESIQQIIIEAVQEWFETHPDYLPDGAVTEPKIDPDFLPKIKNEYVTPQMYGAKGDGETDDTEAIQNALNSGKPVYIPEGVYITSDSLLIPNNTDVFGDGKNSIIRNTATAGSKRSVIAIGDVGQANDPTSPNVLEKRQGTISESRYGLTMAVTDISALELEVGSLILLTNGNMSQKNPENQYVVKVKSISDIYITFDRYLGNYFMEGEVYVQNLDNLKYTDALGIARNVTVHDLSVEQEKDYGSGYYCIAMAGFECIFRNIHAHGSNLIGSNFTAFCVFDNIHGEFDGGFSDTPEYFIESTYRNCKGIRYGRRLNVIGLTITNGFGGTIENCDIDFGNAGKIGASYHKGPIIKNNKLRNLNGTPYACLDLSTYGYNYVANNYISAPEATSNFSVIGTSHNIITDNYIDIPFSRWYPPALPLSSNAIERNYVTGYNPLDVYAPTSPDTGIKTPISMVFKQSVYIAPNEEQEILPETNLRTQSKITKIEVYMTGATSLSIRVNGTSVILHANTNRLTFIIAGDYVVTSFGTSCVRSEFAYNSESSLKIINEGDSTVTINFRTIEQM